MVVYVVLVPNWDDDSTVLGVFSTYDLALQAAVRDVGCSQRNADFFVHKFTVV